ncbi:MAG: GNAT family N-acetyltransferase [Clostridia bacterium]|nr:GNAT family N-acetyltransferase [Clostridia bacterium]
MIILRPFNNNDADNLRINQMPDSSIEEVLSFIKKWVSKSYNCKYFEMLAITMDDAVVGSVSLFERSEHSASLGVEIFPEERGRGYASEAVKLMIEKARSLGYRVIIDQVRIDNQASIALHKKLGFETDGYIYKNAKDREVVLYFLCF